MICSRSSLVKRFKVLRTSSINQDIIIFAEMVRGLMALAQTDDFEQTRKIVEPLWEKLSKRDELFVADIYMLSNILFVFPIETALDIMQFLFRQIERYGNYRNVHRIQYNVILNASLLQIREQHFIEANELLDTILPNLQKENLYAQLAVCYIRKGICFNNLMLDGKQWIEKGKDILLAVNQQKLWEVLEAEIKKYTN